MQFVYAAQLLSGTLRRIEGEGLERGRRERGGGGGEEEEERYEVRESIGRTYREIISMHYT